MTHPWNRPYYQHFTGKPNQPGYGLSHFDGAPLVAGDVYGLRTWRVHQGKLCPQTDLTRPWTTGINEASCTRRRRLLGLGVSQANYDQMYGKIAHGDVPDPSCGCGFYAYHSIDHVAHQEGVLGVIRGSGDMIQGTQGFKAAKAEIVALAFQQMPKSEWRRLRTWKYVISYLVSVYFMWRGLDSLFNGEWGDAISGLGLGLCWSFIFTNFRSMAMNQRRIENPRYVSRKNQRQIRRSYPDAVIYGSTEEMVAAYPFPTDAETREQLFQAVQERQHKEGKLPGQHRSNHNP